MVPIDPIEVHKDSMRTSAEATKNQPTNTIANSLDALRQETAPNEAKRRTINEKLAVLRQETDEKKKEMKEIDAQLLAVAEDQRSALLEKKERLIDEIRAIENIRSQALALQRELQQSPIDRVIDTAGRAVDYVEKKPLNALKLGAVTALGAYLAYKTTKVVIGAVLHPVRTVKKIAGWFTSHINTAVDDGKKAVKENPGGLAKKILIGSIIATASLLGISWLMKHGLKDLAGVLKDAKAFMDGTKSMKDSAVAQGKALLEKGKEGVEKTTESLREELQPWTKYEMSEDDYKNADGMCYKNGVEESAEEIRTEFFKGTSSPAYEKFMADMRKKYDVRENEAKTVKYRRAEVAEKNWQANGKSALLSVEKFLEEHATLVIAGTYFAYQAGILQAIVKSTMSIGEKALALAKALTNFGLASAKKHKFISLLLLVGGALGAFETYKKLKETFLPEDIKSLVKVGAEENGEVVLGAPSDGSLSTFISEVRTHASAIGGVIEDFGGWVKDQSMELLSSLKESIPDAIGLTSEEIIFHRNTGCMDALRKDLTIDMTNTPSKSSDVQEGKYKKYEHALDCLEIYEQKFTLENCTQASKNPKTKEALEDLQEALKAVGITVTLRDGILKWQKDGEKDEYDLSIDPSIEGKEKREELSKTLWHGEGDIDVFVTSALEDLRKQYQDGRLKLEKLTGKDWKGISAVAGPFVFFFDVKWDPLTGFIDFDNVQKYGFAHIEALTGLFSLGTEGVTQENMNAMGQTIGTLAGGGLCMAVTGEVLNAVKRVTIGGGPILTGMKSRVLQNALPFWGPGRFIRASIYTARDIGNFGRFGMQAREINTVCAYAGIRPEWINRIETENLAGLRSLASKELPLNKTYTSLGEDALRDALRTHVKKAFEHVRIRNLKDMVSPTRWRAITAGRSGFEEMYDIIAEGFTGKKPPVKPGAIDIIDAEVVGSTASSAGKAGSTLKEAGDAIDIEQTLKSLARFEKTGVIPTKVIDALKNGTIDSKLAKAINESDDFAKAVMSYLSKADDPVHAIASLNKVASGIEDASLLTKIATSESRLAKVISIADKGGDIAGAFSKTAKIMKGLQVAGVVADVFTIYTATSEMMEAQAKIDALQARGGNDKLQRAYREQQAINVAQVGVAGVGAVSGGIALVGVGGTVGAVAGPVALVTLPISAVLHGAYQGNKWAQEKSRTTKDWRAEGIDPATMTADLRSYEYMTKGAGHLWDFGFDDWRWTYKFSGLGPYVGLYEWISGESDKQFKQLVTDIRSTNETKIRTLVEDTTMINIQTDEQGNPRTPTPEEANALEACLKAKEKHIREQSKSMLTPISGGEDVAELLRNADAIGQIAYRESLVESQGKATEKPDDTKKITLPAGWPARTQSDAEKITAFRAIEKKESMDAIYLQAIMQAQFGMQKADGPEVQANKTTQKAVPDLGEIALANSIKSVMIKELNPAIIRFGVSCKEENFVDWLPDGEAEGVLQTYKMNELFTALEGQSMAIAKSLFTSVQAQQSESTPMNRQPIDALTTNVTQAITEIEKKLLGQRPKELWLKMTEEDKTKARALIATAQKQAEEAQKKQENVQPSQAV